MPDHRPARRSRSPSAQGQGGRIGRASATQPVPPPRWLIPGVFAFWRAIPASDASDEQRATTSDRHRTQPIDARLDPRRSGSLDSSLRGWRHVRGKAAARTAGSQQATRGCQRAVGRGQAARTSARSACSPGNWRTPAGDPLGQRAARRLSEPVRSSIKPLLAASQSQGSLTTRLPFDADFLDLSATPTTPTRGSPSNSAGRAACAPRPSPPARHADIAETLGLLGEIGLTATLPEAAILLDSIHPLLTVGVRVLDDAGGNLSGPPVRIALAAFPSSRRSTACLRPISLVRRRRHPQLEQIGAVLSHGLGQARVTRDDLAVIREAQLRLVEEARRIGLITSPDPASTLDALRG